MLNELINIIRDKMIADEVVIIRGFGKFIPRVHLPRKVHVPGHGMIDAPRSKHIGFVISRPFKKSLN